MHTEDSREATRLGIISGKLSVKGGTKNLEEEIDVPKLEDGYRKNDWALERNWQYSVSCCLLFHPSGDELCWVMNTIRKTKIFA